MTSLGVRSPWNTCSLTIWIRLPYSVHTLQATGYNTALQHCITTLHYNITTLHYNTALQHCITALHYSTALQHYITTLQHYNTALQHCITALHYNTAVQHCIAMYFHSPSLSIPGHIIIVAGMMWLQLQTLVNRCQPTLNSDQRTVSSDQIQGLQMVVK